MIKDINILVERRSAVRFIETNEIQLCPHCNGIGIITREELTDYHRNDYTTVRTSCKFCLGDGRVVVITEKVVYDGPSDDRKVVPYVGFEGDGFSHKSTTYALKIDMRNRRLEEKYPELKKLSYEHYDNTVTDYVALDLLKEK